MKTLPGNLKKESIIGCLLQEGPMEPDEILQSIDPKARFEIEQDELGEYLSNEPEFVVTDSGVYHLTSTASEMVEENVIKQVVMVPHEMEYKKVGSELIEMGLSDPLHNEQGFWIQREQDIEVFDSEGDGFIQGFADVDSLFEWFNNRLDNTMKEEGMPVCENCYGEIAVVKYSDGKAELATIESVDSDFIKRAAEVQCLHCREVFYEEE